MEQTQSYDFVIVGAGISGINVAYRLQESFPSKSYVILEARGVIGGTWDLFRYPGIRSDSELHTFGFPFRPWTHEVSIADGSTILDYIKETASIYGIDKHIKFHHKVTLANWSSQDGKWTLDVENKTGTEVQTKQFTAKFVVQATGYYNYAQGLETVIPGIKNFKGQVVHPQFWPEDLDYTNKHIVIIGSGATAVTLLPALSTKASRVTMLQRSPSYIMPVPKIGKLKKILRNFLPHLWVSFFLFLWSVFFSTLVVFCLSSFSPSNEKIVSETHSSATSC